MIKKRFISMLVLLAAVATGAVAQETYKVSVKEGTEDATKWEIAPAEATTTGVAQGTEVKATYGGAKKVKSVKAKKKAAAPAPAGNIVDLSTLTADYEAQDGDVLTNATTTYKVTIAAGATVTLDGVNISSSGYCIKCAGDATIILKDGSTNTLTSTTGGYPALSIGDANTTLTIQGSTGVLNVTSGGYCAGIGGGYKNTNYTCGNIRIEGGVITAQGGRSGAGIGTDCGAATCGDIIITGGTITAKGGGGAAGIGTGDGELDPTVCGDITIANTVTKVTATKGEFAAHSIGKGYGDNATCGTVTIGDNTGAISESPYTYDPSAPAAAPAATVTTAPTAKGNLHAGLIIPLVTEGVADGGTMMYAVTTDNTQPASTDGFSATVPTAEGLTEACTRYVWYYVKADDTHTDSEISATGIEVTIAEPVEPTLANTLNTAGMTVKVNYNYNDEENYCLFLSNGNGTYTFQSGDGYAGGDGSCAKALVVEDGKLVFKQNFLDTIDEDWGDFGFSVTFDTSNNTYSEWKSETAAEEFNPSFISVEVNGATIAVTAAQ